MIPPVTKSSRRVTIRGDATIIQLEDDFWSALDNIATQAGKKTPDFIRSLYDFAQPCLCDDVDFPTFLRVYAMRHTTNQNDLDYDISDPANRSVDFSPFTPVIL